ncbi:MAG: shikimate dehydrogenase [Oscillospiraceae bacterium]|nr:shikimate dehydrogenase [Oscillospiraceae bacterium]
MAAFSADRKGRHNMKNMVLIGMPGCGKTTLGKDLANQLNRPFTDMDEQLEKQNGVTITQMCERFGKPYFRQKETDIAKQMADAEGFVISAGGGIVLKEENMALLSKNSIIVFIHRTAEDIISGGVRTDNRPFLQDEQALYGLYQERLPLYKKYAQYTVKNKTQAQALQQLLQVAENIWQPKQFYVIGTPIAHSLSPAIHTPVLHALCGNAAYDMQQIQPQQLAAWVQHVRDKNICGFNVTMPHKQTIMPMLDALDETALRYGAVNTVVNRGGKLTGYNTDAPGFFASLADSGCVAQDAHIIVLGAGGAATALITEACAQGAKRVIVLARNEQKAQQALPNHKTATQLETHVLEEQAVFRYCQTADILINCTPLGMHGTDSDFTSLDFIDALPAHAVVADLIYNPPQTKLLQAAQARGLKTQNGLGMLIYQALIADEYYLNTSLNRREMYENIMAVLNKK